MLSRLCRTASFPLGLARTISYRVPDVNMKGCADVRILPVLSDNYCYVITDRRTNTSALVDPGCATSVKDALVDSIDQGANIDYILSTHKHDDHVGGNNELKATFPHVKVYGTGYESIPGRDVSVRDGDTFSLGDLHVRVIHTPCHTKGHVCFYVTSESMDMEDTVPLLFSGDTLFVGGCGRFFEGTPEDMLDNMDIFSNLDTRTLVYCGHEYTLSNLKFLMAINPTAVENYYQRALEMRNRGIPTVPTTIGAELEYNLFMRCRLSETQRLVQCDCAISTMRTLREAKNSFK